MHQSVESVSYENEKFSFEHNADFVIQEKQAEKEGEIWFDIIDTTLDFTIYCSYLPLEKGALPKALEDSYHLAYSHVLVADGIKQDLFRNDSLKTYGTVYDIYGQVATPIQFFVTDSISHFLRGSLYYNNEVRADSVAQVTKLLREDITTLLNTLRWKN